MEGKRIKQEDTDIERLMDLIPCATSRSTRPDNSILIPLAKEERKSSPPGVFTKFCHATRATSPDGHFGMPFGKPSDAFLHSSQGSSVEKIQTHRSLDGGESDVKVGHQALIKTVDWEVSDSFNEQPLTSAFSALSFKDGLSIEETNFQRVNTLNSINLLRLPSSGFDQFSVEMNYQEKMDFQKIDDQSTEHKAYSWQPLAHQMNPPKVLSSLPAPGIEVPAVLYPQHYFPSVQYSLPQMHLHELSKSCTPWFHMDEENLTRENGNVTTGLRTWNIRQSCIDLPVSYEHGHLSQESFQNYDAIPRGLTCSGPKLTGSSACRYCAQAFCGSGASCPFVNGNIVFPTNPLLAHSAKGFDELQDFGKVGKQKFPEKILTRKNGLNLVNTVKFNSVEENEPPKHFRADGRVLSNGHLHLNAHIQSAGSFQLDGRNFWGQAPDTTGGMYDKLRLQPQKYGTVDEVTGRIYYMAKDQDGCRTLQRKLTEGAAEDVEKILLEIVGHLAELMTHPFGNYLVQRLLQVCDEDQMTQIVYAVTIKAGELVRISCNKHGTRVVQEVVKTIKSSQQASRIVSSLKPGIVDLIKDTNGYHVAKHCLEYLTPGYIKFLFDAVTAHCVELATNRHGCCVLKDCLNRSDGEQKSELISDITSNALILSQDPFGNYVVQHVFELKISWATAEVLKQLEGNYGSLSKQKYGSNVVEKCLEYAGEEHFPRVIHEFIDNSPLDRIMQDRYGNFVIQTALNHSKGALHAALMEAIRPHIPALRTSPYGKKVLSCHGFKKQAMLISTSSLVKTRFSSIS